ncbi:MAG: hypothetical protein LCH92_12945 [Proteobacteria bacterium]|nr:hypothetical protein [Pseudomonadota bacterium]
MSELEMEIEALKTSLGALRSLVARLVATLPEADQQALCDWLVRSSMAPDGQEDPGAVPIKGIANGMARAAEMDEILALVRRYRAEE